MAMVEDLEKLAKKLSSKGPEKLEACSKRIRVLFNKKYIVDTLTAKYVWEHPYYPVYWVPYDSLNSSIIHGTKKINESADILTINVGHVTTNRVLSITKGSMEGLVRLEFAAMDSWFEEEERIYVHPRDPYKRITILQSSRPVKVEIEGTVVAESSNVMVLHETSLPTRYYLPPTSVKWELLDSTETVTSCPYKGEANYYSVTINGKEFKDVIWWYKYPTKESIEITGRVCFYNEKVDIWVDGVKEEQPKSVFS